MKTELEKVVKAERKVSEDIKNAQMKKNELIAAAIEEGTIEANKTAEETEAKILGEIEENKQQIHEIDEKLQNVVKLENDKIVKKVSAKIEQITEQIYKEALSND